MLATIIFCHACRLPNRPSLLPSPLQWYLGVWYLGVCLILSLLSIRFAPLPNAPNGGLFVTDAIVDHANEYCARDPVCDQACSCSVWSEKDCDFEDMATLYRAGWGIGFGLVILGLVMYAVALIGVVLASPKLLKPFMFVMPVIVLLALVPVLIFNVVDTQIWKAWLLNDPGDLIAIAAVVGSSVHIRTHALRHHRRHQAATTTGSATSSFPKERALMLSTSQFAAPDSCAPRRPSPHQGPSTLPRQPYLPPTHPPAHPLCAQEDDVDRLLTIGSAVWWIVYFIQMAVVASQVFEVGVLIAYLNTRSHSPLDLAGGGGGGGGAAAAAASLLDSPFEALTPIETPTGLYLPRGSSRPQTDLEA